MIRSFALLVACLVAMLVPAHGARAFDMPEWQSPEGRDHPLAGTVWHKGKASTAQALAQAIAGADYAALGEIHINPDHHALQALLMRAIAARGRKPSVVFEMVPQSLEARLQQIQAAPNPDPTAIGPALDWEKRGWPAWPIYQPVAQAALDLGLPMHAGDLDRDRIRTIAKGGLQSLDKTERARFGLDRDLPPDVAGELTRELVASHCGMLPETMLPGMALVQRSRDGALAASMRDNNRGDGAILIAGAGHVRNDRAVPWLLRELEPESSVISVGMLEVRPGETRPDVYLENELYDWVILTPRSETTDPCERMREQMKARETTD